VNKSVRNTVAILFVIAMGIYFGFMYLMVNAAGQ